MDDKLTTLEILTGARDLLVDRFGKRNLVTTGGRYCALGAVNKIADVEQTYYQPRRSGTPVERAVFFLANAVTGGTENLSDDTVYDLNDKRGKTATLKMFDRAISNCRRRHVSNTPLDLDA